VRPYFLRVVEGCCQNGVCCHTNYWKNHEKNIQKKNYFRPTDPNFLAIWNRNHIFFFYPHGFSIGLRHSYYNNKALRHSLSRYHGLEARQTSKPQNRRPLFDVELYLTVHKSFVSTSLNTIHPGCTFHLSYPYWTFTSNFIIRKYNEFNHRDRAQININSDKNIKQWLMFSCQTTITW
jgi:hypothetical protein